jgi:hypothetical protein
MCGYLEGRESSLKAVTGRYLTMGHSDLLEIEDSALGFSDASLQKHKDSRLGLASRIVASQRFARAPLLSNFLLYIVTETVEGRANDLSEHKIGVCVFDRPRSYRTVEDNIVRNYARQLRRRLDEYYVTEGRNEPLRIEIPKGGYVPVFRSTRGANAEKPHQLLVDQTSGEPQDVVLNDLKAPVEHHGHFVETQRSPVSRRPWVLATVGLALALAASLIALSRVWMHSPKSAGSGIAPNRALWAQLFTANRDTLVVPADTALVTVEDMNQRQYSLTEYLSWSSVEHPGLGFDTGLRIRKYTDIESLDITNQLIRLPEWKPGRAFIRTASKLNVEDLKDDNLILIGSVYSIPWIQLLDNDLNFHLFYEPKFGRAHIENRHPAAGEAAIYANQWNGVNETDYAVLALIPNLNHTGQILMLEGLDGSGMYALRDVLFGDKGLQYILKKCTRPDGTVRPFEALLEASSVDSHSTGIRIVSIHMLD